MDIDRDPRYTDRDYHQLLTELINKDGRGSQTRVSSRMGIDQSTLHRIMRGSRLPTRDTSFYEKLATISWIDKDEIVELLKTSNAPRVLKPNSEAELNIAQAKFGTNFRILRKKEGRTLENIAIASRIDQSTIARMELGERFPPKEPNFYDSLYRLLDLSHEDYVRLVLTTKPPRWMFPDLYERFDAFSNQETIISVIIENVGIVGLKFPFEVPPITQAQKPILKEKLQAAINDGLAEFLSSTNQTP